MLSSVCCGRVIHTTILVKIGLKKQNRTYHGLITITLAGLFFTSIHWCMAGFEAIAADGLLELFSTWFLMYTSGMFSNLDGPSQLCINFHPIFVSLRVLCTQTLSATKLLVEAWQLMFGIKNNLLNNLCFL